MQGVNRVVKQLSGLQSSAKSSQNGAVSSIVSQSKHAEVTRAVVQTFHLFSGDHRPGTVPRSVS